MKKEILLLSILLITLFSYSQDNISDEILTSNEEFAKNYISTDVSLTFGGFAGLNYEHLFKTKKGNSISIVAGGGLYTLIYIGGSYASLQTNYCIGKKSNHIEFGAGALLIADYGFFKNALLIPDLHIAYKYQKPGKKFVFKSGIGIPRGISLGVGYAF